MSKFKIKVNYDGVGELLKSAELFEELWQLGMNVAASLEDGYEVLAMEDFNGNKKSFVAIGITGEQAMIDNLENNVLLRAVGG